MKSIAARALSIGATIRSGLASAAGVRRSALLNGAASGLAVAFGASIGSRFFPAHAAAILLGAICVSVADVPVSLDEKTRRIGLAWILSILSMGAAAAALGDAAAEAVVVACVGFCAAMVTAYGRNAIPISVSALLALVFAPSVATPGSAVWTIAAWFGLGGLLYGAFALLATPVLATQTKRMLLRETLDGVSTFLRAQQIALEQNDEPRMVYGALIDAQAALADRVQAARDVVFTHIATNRDRLYAALLVILIDIFEIAVSEQADLDILLELRDEHDACIKDLHALLLLAARDLDRFSRSLGGGGRRRAPSPEVDRNALLKRLAADLPSDSRRRQAVRSTADKIELLFRHIERMSELRDDPPLAPAVIQGIDLGHFIQKSVFDLRTVMRQLNLRAPVFRYAIRLSLALLCGFLVGQALPNRAHGTWILLTIALVMRANYSVTRQRRDERLLGNILGCGLSAAILVASPPWALPSIIFFAVAVSHAFVIQSYLVSSIASCVMALGLIHVSEPNGDAFFLLMRVLDTGLGAAIAHIFSFLLPTWEHKMIAAQVPDLIGAAATYADQALSPDASDETYRLARRRVYDATASMSASARRMIDEPASLRSDPRTLSGLLAASYALVAELAAIQLYLRAHRGAPEPKTAAELARARRLIEETLDRKSAKGAGRASGSDEALAGESPISGRLARAVFIARKLAVLASQMQAATLDAARASAIAG